MSMMHRSEHDVGADGTLTLRDLRPGAHVCVVVYEPKEPPELEPGSIPGASIYKPHLPRVPWGSLTIRRYDRPFDPAVDPEDWDANR